MIQRTPDNICGDLLVDLREALAPFARQTDAEIMARPDLTPPEARLVVNTRRAVATYEARRDDIIGEPRAVPVRRRP